MFKWFLEAVRKLRYLSIMRIRLLIRLAVLMAV